MLYLTVFIITSVILFSLEKKFSRIIFVRQEREYLRLKRIFENNRTENGRLKNVNSELEKTADDTIALYDITKEICKTLDKQKVFELFKENLVKFIEIEDCQFLEKVPQGFADDRYLITPLKMSGNDFAYLLVRGIKQQDRDKFNILVQQFILGIKRAFLYARVQELAITDSLTQALSRRYFMERFEEEIERSEKLGLKFSLLIVDIDHFKEYNDRYGHLVGDTVLKEVSALIKENIREIDLIGRYGGDEFLMLFTETDKEQANFAAERIREKIEKKEISAYDEKLRVTISVGIAVFPENSKGKQSLIDAADQALYLAKQAGRNKVFLAG